jgi:hypothetical protein
MDELRKDPVAMGKLNSVFNEYIQQNQVAHNQLKSALNAAATAKPETVNPQFYEVVTTLVNNPAKATAALPLGAALSRVNPATDKPFEKAAMLDVANKNPILRKEFLDRLSAYRQTLIISFDEKNAIDRALSGEAPMQTDKLILSQLPDYVYPGGLIDVRNPNTLQKVMAHPDVRFGTHAADKLVLLKK